MPELRLVHVQSTLPRNLLAVGLGCWSRWPYQTCTQKSRTAFFSQGLMRPAPLLPAPQELFLFTDQMCALLTVRGFLSPDSCGFG